MNFNDSLSSRAQQILEKVLYYIGKLQVPMFKIKATLQDSCLFDIDTGKELLTQIDF